MICVSISVGLVLIIIKRMKVQKPGKTPEMEQLPDPRGNRQVKEVQPPVHLPLSESLLFGPSLFYCQFIKYRQEAKLANIVASFQTRREIVERTCA